MTPDNNSLETFFFSMWRAPKLNLKFNNVLAAQGFYTKDQLKMDYETTDKNSKF